MVQAFGEDGKEWSSIPGPKVTAVSTTPVAGTSTDATEVRVNVNMTQAEQAAAATAALLATRYELRCGSNYSKPPAHSYKDVWTSPEYKSGGTCVLNIDGQSAYSHVSLLPQEQAIVDVIASHGGDVSLPAGAFGAAFTLCARVDAGYADQIVARMDWKKADAYGALALCPDAPHAAVLQEVATAVKVGDGTHVVGQDMEPGTYHSPPSSKDCYWSRTTGGGGIIANDFVGFAPNGVTVSVAAGEGFESQNCGSWTKTG